MAEDALSREGTAGPAETAADPLPLIILGLACFASNISVRAVAPMLPVIAGQFSVSLHDAAWLATAYGICYALSQPLLGPLADAFGKSAIIKSCLALLAISFAACACAPSFATLMMARGASGAVAGGVVPAAFALIGDRVPFARRQFAISRLVIAVIIGQMAGAVLGGALAQWTGWRSVFVATTLFAAGVAAAGFLGLDGGRERRRHFSIVAAVRDYGFLMTDRRALIVYGTVFCEGLSMFGIFPFVAPALLAHGEGGTLAAGLCLAAYGLGGLVYCLCAGFVIRRLGPWRMMATGGIVIGVCYGFATHPVPWTLLAGLFACGGFGFYLIHNTMQALGTELAPEARGAALALFASFYFVGQGLGPLMSGQVAAHFGYGAMFGVSAALMAALGFLSSRLLKRV